MNWGLFSIFGRITSKQKHPHKFNSGKLLMLSETILEMSYCQLNFGKNKLKILRFWGEGTWNWFPYLGPLAQNKERLQIETLWSSWSVKCLVSPLLPRRKRLWQEVLWFLNICFVKFLICPYWAKNVTVLTVWVSVSFTVFTISLDFQNMYIFFQSFFVRTFYHAVCNIFNIRN